MKYLCIGDAHFQTNNMDEIDEFLFKLEEFLKTTSFDFIVCMGDTLHTHEKIHTLAYNKCLDYFVLLGSHAKTFVLVGNHDYINNSQFLTENHPFNACKMWMNVTIVDRVIAYKGYIFCPYVPDGRFVEALSTEIEYLYDGPDIQKDISLKGWKGAITIFAHQLIDNAKMGAIIASGVEEWKEDWPCVMSGHVHDKQWPYPNWYYLGSSRQIAYGESADKTIAIGSDTSHGTLAKKKSLSIDEIDLHLIKKKIVYKHISEVEKFIADLGKDSKEISSKTKLTLRGDLNDFKAFKKGTQYKKLLKAGIKINFKEIKEAKSEENINKKDRSTQKFDSILLSLIQQTPMEELYKRIREAGHTENINKAEIELIE